MKSRRALTVWSSRMGDGSSQIGRFYLDARARSDRRVEEIFDL
jgi:hypothetical protein